MSRIRWGWLLFAVALVVVALLLWSRTHIVIVVPIPLGGFLLLIAGLVVLVWLALRLIFRR